MLHPARNKRLKRRKGFSPRQILRACRCLEHPLIQQARRNPTQTTCVHALLEFIQNMTDGKPEAQGLDSPLTVC